MGVIRWGLSCPEDTKARIDHKHPHYFLGALHHFLKIRIKNETLFTMKKHLCYLVLLIGMAQPLAAQSDYRMKGNTDEVDANFLFGYYNQDGNNAAVTGGIGTEALQDYASLLVVNVPLDSVQALSINLGADFYSSASTDNIDNFVSSASSQDLRTYGTVGYTRKNLGRGETFGVGAGFSTEYDYSSVSGRVSYAKEWNEGNSELSANAQAFFDQWSLIYPIELRTSLRNQALSPGRRSYNLQVAFSQVVNKRLQFLLSGEAIYMDGLLSTPFHRVYFVNQTAPDIERLPSTRLKIPLGLRVNYFPFDNFIIRTNYRYYWDDFGVLAHTFELETPIKLGTTFTLYPFYRYHTQTAADYFAPYATHQSAEEFYTSDYDLSALNSQKFGLGIGYAPLYGIGRMNLAAGKRMLILDKIMLRSAYYTRSTGLTAFLMSIDVSFKLKRK